MTSCNCMTGLIPNSWRIVLVRDINLFDTWNGAAIRTLCTAPLIYFYYRSSCLSLQQRFSVQRMGWVKLLTLEHWELCILPMMISMGLTMICFDFGESVDQHRGRIKTKGLGRIFQIIHPAHRLRQNVASENGWVTANKKNLRQKYLKKRLHRR